MARPEVFSLGREGEAQAMDRPVFVETRHWAKAKSTYVSTAKRRALLARCVVVLSLALAGWLGSALGGGSLTAEARFNAERLAAQSGQATSYGPAQVSGHPGAARLQQTDLIRQFIALDGVN